VATKTVADLLQEWRAAERRWERPGSSGDVRAAALQVIRAWARYQNAALPTDTREFMLVADDEGRYVAATEGVARVLGYDPQDLVGRAIADIAAPDLADQTPQEWAKFLADGRQDGTFRLQGASGSIVALHYQARAHHPVPGYHVSRLWPAVDELP
jgi:PAS domain S-box-containing protein